ncbi:MAG: FAD-dependent thymidylate synthase, partial [Firmicutes bacterium]|nr:FAD-dependent thymidylate synthase [Bacillota bacterium]
NRSGRPALRVYNDTLQTIQEAYDVLNDLGVPKEDARFVLPGGAETNLVTTLNYRSLLDLYHKRVVTPGAQWEIRTLVRRMAELVVEREPWLAEFFPEPVSVR